MRGYIKTAFKNDAAHTLTKTMHPTPGSREDKRKRKKVEKNRKEGKNVLRGKRRENKN